MFYDVRVPELEPRRADIEFLEQPCKSALNPVRGMPFKWSLNPYMGCEHRCTFCYVRNYEKRADRPSGHEYGRAVRVKVNVASVLRSELASPRWRREQVSVGAATDPYQPAEGRYRLTRACLEAFADHATPVALITRGPMVVRDRDVLVDLARRGGVSVSFSVPTLDHDVWRRTEPGTAPPRQRLRALRQLVDAGVRCGVSMAPLIPGLSDGPGQVEEVVRAVRDAGAAFLWANVLYLKEGTREHFLESVGRHWPELLPMFESDYAGRAYLPTSKTKPVQERVQRLAVDLGVGRQGRLFIEPSPPPAPEQLSLLAG